MITLLGFAVFLALAALLLRARPRAFPFVVLLALAVGMACDSKPGKYGAFPWGGLPIDTGGGPKVTSVDHTTGPIEGGYAIHLTGSGFSGGMTSTLGSVSAITSTTCTVTTSAHAAGNFGWTLHTTAGTSAIQTHTYVGDPTLTFFRYVDVSGGTTFGIGTNFDATAALSATISGTPTSLVSVIVASTGTFLNATLTQPGPYTAGNWNITLTQFGGIQSVTLTSGFTVFQPSTITSPPLAFDLDSTVSLTCGGSACSNGGGADQWIAAAGSPTWTAPASPNKPTYTTNCVGTWPCLVSDGVDDWLKSTSNVDFGGKIGSLCWVAEVDAASANDSFLYEQGTNAYLSTTTLGFSLLYETVGPQLRVSMGSTATSGGGTRNDEVGVLGSAINTDYHIGCTIHDRTATYPITIAAGTPLQNQLFFDGSKSGLAALTLQTNASSFTVSPFSIFAHDNGAGAVAGASKTKLLRLFAYKGALNYLQISNITAALAARYGLTSSVNFTGTLLVIADSISSVPNGNGVLTWTTYGYTLPFFDNRIFEVLAVGGWTISDAYTNRALWAPIRRAELINDALFFIGTNDLSSSDILSPATVWTSSLQPAISYVRGLTAPAIRNVYVMDELPRGVVSSGTATSFEVKRTGRDASGVFLADWAAATSYSSALPSWVRHLCSGVAKIFRASAGGTFTSGGSIAFDCTDGHTTTDGTGTWTNYGRPYNDLIDDPTNQSTYNYVALPVGDTSLPIGQVANLADTHVYLDQIHPNQAFETGQDAGIPTGEPFAGSLAAAAYGVFRQTGDSGIPYIAPTITQVTPTTAARGSPLTLFGVAFGDLDPSHPVQIIDGSSVAWDCTSVVRYGDEWISVVTPAGIGLGGPYTVRYLRVDGQVATKTSAVTIAASAITAVTLGAMTNPSPTAVTLPTTTHNPHSVKISCSNGGCYGISAATFKGTSMTGCASDATGATATCTYPVTAGAAGTGDVAVTTPSSPSNLTSGAVLATLDPSTICASTTLRGWYRGDSLVCSSGTATSWADKSSIGNNLTGIGGAPACNATSANYVQGVTGIASVSLNGTSDRFLRPNPTFTMGGSTPTPVTIAIMAKFSGGSNGARCARYSTTGGAMALGYVSAATLKPMLDATWTLTYPTAISTTLSYSGHVNGLTASTGGLAVSGGADTTGSGAMTGGGITVTGLFAVGYDAGSSFCGGEIEEAVVCNFQWSDTNRFQYSTYAHDWANTPY